MMSLNKSRHDHDIAQHDECPTEEQLRQLIAGPLADSKTTDAEQARLTAHLDSCPPCCDRVSRRAGDVPAGGAPAADMSSVSESAMVRAVDRIKIESPTSCFGSGSNRREAVQLDFLSPADDPSHLANPKSGPWKTSSRR